jgi:hypothetical protein
VKLDGHCRPRNVLMLFTMVIVVRTISDPFSSQLYNFRDYRRGLAIKAFISSYTYVYHTLILVSLAGCISDAMDFPSHHESLEIP